MSLRVLRLTVARELGKFPHEVGRMPFADAIDLIELPALVERAKPRPKRSELEEMRAFKAAVEAANG